MWDTDFESGDIFVQKSMHIHILGYKNITLKKLNNMNNIFINSSFYKRFEIILCNSIELNCTYIR